MVFIWGVVAVVLGFVFNSFYSRRLKEEGYVRTDNPVGIFLFSYISILAMLTAWLDISSYYEKINKWYENGGK